MTGQPRKWPRFPLLLISLAVLIGVGFLIYWFTAILLNPMDVRIYVNASQGPELSVFVDGKPSALYSKAGNYFLCSHGTREITIKRGEETLFHQTKTLHAPMAGKVRKYLLSLGEPAFYCTFELEYVNLQDRIKNVKVDIGFDNQLMLTDDIFPAKKQEKINNMHRRQLESLRKVRFQVEEGKWLEVDDCHYVLQYPPSMVPLKPPKTKTTQKSIVPISSTEHARLKRVLDIQTPSLDDVQFLGNFLTGLQNSGGSTEPYIE